MSYGEFAYLGESTGQTGKHGITFDGASVLGSLSSSTVHNGYYGIYINASSSNTLNNNNPLLETAIRE